MKTAFIALGVVALILYASPSFATNAGDFAGAVAIGTSYAGTVSAPTDGLAVQGSVGIGTSNPLAPLDIRNTGTNANGAIFGYNDEGVSIIQNWPAIYLNAYYNSSNPIFMGTGYAGAVYLKPSTGDFGIDISTASGTLGNVAVWNTPLLIKNNGNVGIGTMSPSYLLHVGNSAASGIIMELQNSSGACTYNPGASSVTVSCSSDARLKGDIQDSESALPWIDDMRVRDFTVKATDEQRTGVVAQEVALKHPEMVHENVDGFYSVDEPNPWILVKALQEQQSEIAELKAEVEKLKQH
jgi:hypothetical protein